jgi:hypothetical protein
MPRAATLRGLVGIAAGGGRACGQGCDAGCRGFRAGAGRGKKAKAAPGSSSTTLRQAQVVRGASAVAGNRAGWVSGGFER